MNKEAVKELLIKMADDELILGHRNSEWTGLAPILEEDIAFSSMAQDKIGHAQALYTILNERFGTTDIDSFAFLRKEEDFKCCWLVEQPIGEFDFSLVRQFLFDQAESIRYGMLRESSYAPLARLAAKIRGELKFHILHANTWIRKFGQGSKEGQERIQNAINETWDSALGIFEAGPNESDLIADGVFSGEEALKAEWLETVDQILNEAGFTRPDRTETPSGQGRSGAHSEHLAPLLEEMSYVLRLDPEATW